MRKALVDDRPILLLRRTDALFAFQGRCPHEGGVLANGTLERDRVICPLHGAAFAIPGGTLLTDPDGIAPPSGDVPSLTSYPARVTSGTVEVDLG